MHAHPFSRSLSRSPRRHLSAFLAGATLAGFAVLALAGCGSNGAADPLLAGRVNGNPITLSQYDDMMRFTVADSAAQGHFSDLQSPTDRQNLDAAGQGAMDWLVGDELAREQVAAQHVKVTTQERQDAQATVTNFSQQVQQQLQTQPSNTQMQELLNSMTPEVRYIIADRLASEQALADQGQLPYAHLRAIFSSSQSDADNLLKQVQQGADFGTLARAQSTDQASAQTWGDLGNVFVGQDSPAGSAGMIATPLETKVFAPGAHPAKDFVVPAEEGFAVVEVMSQGKGQLPQDERMTSGITIVEAWLASVVQPRSGVDQYVALS